MNLNIARCPNCSKRIRLLDNSAHPDKCGRCNFQFDDLLLIKFESQRYLQVAVRCYTNKQYSLARQLAQQAVSLYASNENARLLLKLLE